MKKSGITLNKTRAAIALCAALFASAGSAQTLPADYPNKPIKLVVAFAPGGVGDRLARIIQQKMNEKFKQTVIVENKPGASGTIGADMVIKAPADGYTLLITNQVVVQVAGLFKKMPYDPLNDLIPVTDLIGAPLWLAVNTANTKAQTLKEFIAEVKSKPKTGSYASVGLSSIGHLYGVQLNDAAGIDLLHVPYKGSNPVVMALVGGEVTAAFSDYATMKPHIDSGKLRMLAISKPSPATPNVPTFASLGYKGFESYSWVAMFAPGKTPLPIVQGLQAEITRILKLPDVAATLDSLGLEAGGQPQAQFAALVRDDLGRWKTLMAKAGIKPE